MMMGDLALSILRNILMRYMTTFACSIITMMVSQRTGAQFPPNGITPKNVLTKAMLFAKSAGCISIITTALKRVLMTSRHSTKELPAYVKNCLRISP